jgi:hypothetical protein
MLSSSTQLYADGSAITIHLPGPTNPDPPPVDADEIPLLPLDRVMIIESMIALDFIQFPESSVLSISSGGPREVVAKFVDGPNQLMSRYYQKPFVYIVIPNIQGNVTLKMVCDGHHVGDKIETQLLIVSGEGPRPPPGPGPDPKPEPPPIVAKNVRISVITDADQITVEQAAVLNALVGWNALQDAGNEYRWYDSQTEEPDGKKAIEQLNGPIPGMVYTDKASGKVLKYGPIPATFNDLKTIVKELTGG